MALLKRLPCTNGLCFITCVTANRAPVLLNRPDLFLSCWKAKVPLAWVVMPDHFHAILPIETDSLSRVVRRFKVTYAWHFNSPVAFGSAWQKRFWDHWIRSDEDLRRHVDYIHFNPVHHGMTDDPFCWKESSLRQYFEKGWYERDWGCYRGVEVGGNFGE